MSKRLNYFSLSRKKSDFSRNMKYAILFFFMSVFGTAGLAFSQTLTVSGTILDPDSQPLIGATVLVHGTTNGTLTNVSGNYTITNVAKNDSLEFSFVGMETQVIPVNGRAKIDVALNLSSKVLDDIIVVGYSTQSKRTISTAISAVQSEELTRTSATNPSAALAGKIQGVTSRAADGRPGSNTNIQIRNMGAPLFVIDGIPVGQGYTTFDNMAIEDIESITVLKDASAAIYGLRASNGVVLVTTKTGTRSDEAKISVNGYYGFQNFTRFPDVVNGQQYVLAKLQSIQNQGGNPNTLYTPDQYQKFVEGTEYGYKSYDYRAAVVRNNIPQTYINANASGGTKRATYYLSVSNVNQSAILKDYSYSRTNVQSNITASLVKGLTIGSKMSLQVADTKMLGVSGSDEYEAPFKSIIDGWPIQSFYANDNPDYVNETHNRAYNPAVYNRDFTGFEDSKFTIANLTLDAEYNFGFGLKAKAMGQYMYQVREMTNFEYKYKTYKYDALNDKYITDPNWGNQNVFLEGLKSFAVARFLSFQLTYNKKLNDHNISAVAAYERSDRDNNELENVSSPPTNYIQKITFGEMNNMYDTWSLEARAGFIGRINYDYRQKYLLEVLARYDGSYIYAPDKRWGLFPAFSAGWRVNQENFFKNSLGNLFSDFKLRFSLGKTGSESGVSAWDYVPKFNYSQGNAILDGVYVTGVSPAGLPITNISWVNNISTNLGVDIGMLKGRLNFQFDAFQRKRTGIPAGRYDILLPSEVGYSLPNENLNSDATVGVEGMVSYKGEVGDFRYSVSANATLSRSKTLETYKPRRSNSWDEYRNSSEGRWNSTAWVYDCIGQFQSVEEIENYKINNDGKANSTMLPGDLKYRDVNGDGIISGFDQVPLGYATGSNPYMSYALNTNLSYKAFSLSIDFSGGTMQTYSIGNQVRVPFYSDGSAVSYMATDVWHQADPYDNTSAWIPGTYPAIRSNDTGHSNYQNSDFWYINVTYIRLKNCELSYSLPKSILSKLGGIQRVRVYVNGSNLFSLDPLRKFKLDPEISASSALVYPQSRMINTGFNITF